MTDLTRETQPGGVTGATVAPVAAAPSRWGAIDAVRGSAMAFVCVSHFAMTYFPPGDPRGRWLRWVGMVATPTFVMLSGLVVGYVVRRAPGGLRAVGRGLVDRGLFLLLVAHPLIVLAHVPLAGGLRAALPWVHVTDTIGVCLILAPLLLRLAPLHRAAAGAAVYAAGWLALGASTPPGWPAALKEVLVGSSNLRHLAYVFPIVPWLGAYAVATVIGERLTEARREGPARASRLASRLALAAFGLTAGLRVASSALRLPARHPALAAMTRMVKLPPTPAYLAFFTGVGLAMLAAFIELERREAFPWLREAAALVGRNSLAAFLAQYFVYCTGMVLLRPPVGRAWPLWMIGSAVPVVLVALAWDRIGGNRFFTVGLRPRRPGAPAAGRGAAA
jgi:hypothetical protein